MLALLSRSSCRDYHHVGLHAFLWLASHHVMGATAAADQVYSADAVFSNLAISSNPGTFSILLKAGQTQERVVL
jgi:hypothetical protein